MSAEPRLTPFNWNWTDETPTLSDAVADTVTVPLTVALLAGALSATAGAIESAVALFTVIEMVPDVDTLPAASRA